jgi:hypothetical protein
VPNSVTANQQVVSASHTIVSFDNGAHNGDEASNGDSTTTDGQGAESEQSDESEQSAVLLTP